jgi:hypothetical protein
MDNPTIQTPASTGPGTARVGYYRWNICALLLFAAVINYIDRRPEEPERLELPILLFQPKIHSIKIIS